MYLFIYLYVRLPRQLGRPSSAPTAFPRSSRAAETGAELMLADHIMTSNMFMSVPKSGHPTGTTMIRSLTTRLVCSTSKLPTTGVAHVMSVHKGMLHVLGGGF